MCSITPAVTRSIRPPRPPSPPPRPPPPAPPRTPPPRPLHRRHAEQLPVVAAEPDARLPVPVDPLHDVLVDLADEHHLGDLDRRLVAHAQATDELPGQVEPLHVAGALRAPAVDDDRVHADVLEEHDVAREVLAQLRVVHRRAAVLDDDGTAV